MFSPAQYTPEYLHESVPQLVDLARESDSVDAFRLQINN